MRSVCLPWGYTADVRMRQKKSTELGHYNYEGHIPPPVLSETKGGLPFPCGSTRDLDQGAW
jgi:hypothetical protein